MGNDINSQQDATTVSFINLLNLFLNQPNMFRATNSPILRSTFVDCTYSFWYNAPLLLPNGAMVEFHLKCGTGRQQKRCIVPKAVHTAKKLLLRMGEFIARNTLG